MLLPAASGREEKESKPKQAWTEREKGEGGAWGEPRQDGERTQETNVQRDGRVLDRSSVWC